jgi:plastocyanin
MPSGSRPHSLEKAELVLRTNVRWLPIVLAALTATALESNITPAAAGPKSTTHTIVIEAMRFDPQELTVKAGDTIVWINHDPFPHTATAVGRQFDSREIATQRSWKYTASRTGVFRYACSLHPTMLGTLRVE